MSVKKVLGTVVIAFVALLAGVIGRELASEMWSHIGNKRSKGLEWKERSLFGGALLADMPCEPTNTRSSESPPIREGVRVQMLSCTASDLMISVGLVDSVEQGSYALDRGTAGFVNALRAKLLSDGAIGFLASEEDALMFGLPARRVSASCQIKGEGLCIDALIASDGEDGWILQVGYPGSNIVNSDAERIISSVKFRPD